MPRQKQAVLEYRSYDLPADFPLFMLTGEHWRISPVPSQWLHIHNCLEIGLCHSDSGEMILGEQQYSFQSGYVTCIARNVPHTTWSSPGTHSLWSYLFVEPETLLGRFGISQVPEGREVFRDMSVRENLDMGAYGRSDAGGMRIRINQNAHSNSPEAATDSRNSKTSR